jgi:hypothetical protein
MNIIYTLSIIIITLILNTSVSYAMPFMKSKINAFIGGIKRKLNAPNKTDIRLNEFDKQIDTLTKRVMKVNEGNRELIRKVVREYLEELQNK